MVAKLLALSKWQKENSRGKKNATGIPIEARQIEKKRKCGKKN